MTTVKREGAIRNNDNGSDGDQPLNLSLRPSETLLTPSPAIFTPHVKSELPNMPGAALQAAFKTFFPRNLPSTTIANRQLLTVPDTQQTQQIATALSSPSIPLVIQKINQSGGEMKVSPDPKFAVDHYRVQGITKEIKKEPGTESLDLSQLNPYITIKSATDEPC